MEVQYRWHPYFGLKVRLRQVQERGQISECQGPSRDRGVDGRLDV